MVMNDGAFFIDKETAIAKSIKTGDGFSIKIESDQVIEITGKIKIDQKPFLNFCNKFEEMIRQNI